MYLTLQVGRSTNQPVTGSQHTVHTADQRQSHEVREFALYVKRRSRAWLSS